MLFNYGGVSIDISTFFLLGCIILFLILRKMFRRRSEGRTGGRSLLGAISGAKGDLTEDAESFAAKYDKGNTIAVVEIYGTILDEARMVPPFARRSASFGYDLRRILSKLADNANIKGVLVRMHTPGGTVSGSYEIYNGLRACAVKKPTVVHIASLSASGGVLSMVGANRIIADKEALIGSIGVRGPTIHEYTGVKAIKGGLFSSGVEADTMQFHGISAGAGKSFGDPFLPASKEAIERFRTLIEGVYVRFVGHVCNNRKTDPSKIREMGAAVIGAEEAQRIGLIDGIDDYAGACEQIASLAGLKSGECNFHIFRQTTKQGLSLIFSDFVPQLSGSQELVQGEINTALAQHPVLVHTKW